jgi:hypothetical protein
MKVLMVLGLTMFAVMVALWVCVTVYAIKTLLEK